MAPTATASTDCDSSSKRKRGEESEDEEDQARPIAFRTLPPEDKDVTLAQDWCWFSQRLLAKTFEEP